MSRAKDFAIVSETD